MTHWNGRKVLVTGAGGFIGSHLTERLVREGAEVRVLLRYRSDGGRGHLDALAADVSGSLDVHASTVEDPFAVRRAVQGCDTVFHLAALIGIPYSYVAPHHYVSTNVLGTLHVLEACRQEGVQRVVHTSTSETYGSAQYTPIDERHPLMGQSPYSASKIGADQMAIAYHRSFGLPVAILRPFNTYGPRQSARAIIPTVLAQVLGGATELRVGNLAPRRDLNFVEDTVAGFLGIATCSAALGEVVNVGSGKTISVGDLVQRVFAVTGRTLPIVQHGERMRPEASEVMLLQAATDKAQRLFGYAPAVGLDEGLRRTAIDVEANLGRYRMGVFVV
ncbi:MAG: NAD-dependent epimerase/dehydratase family protein [Myxococcales bacterium]|nr:NAD-dependent epimerase/dehydratase family protein [Myxococcales bacterium]